MAKEIVFDASGLNDLADDLRHAARHVHLEVDKALAKIGAELLAAAKAIASEHSAKVASTIRLRVVPGMLVIAAGNDQTPIAALWETGNKGSKADTTRVAGVWFRHPVFGSKDVWVNQRRFPFLRPAFAADRKRINKAMAEALDHGLRPYRL